MLMNLPNLKPHGDDLNEKRESIYIQLTGRFEIKIALNIN